MIKKTNVVLLFGGKSVEHDISIRSAQNVFEFINKESYNVKLVGIDQAGGWHLTSSAHKVIAADPMVVLTSDGHLLEIDTQTKHPVDIVFPVLHGTDGEDGSVQGIIKACNLPCVGSGVLGSAVSMNKLVSKQLLKSAGIPVSDFSAFHFHEKETISFDTLKKKLGLPFMAKPSNLGSSVGVSKVTDEESFDKALTEGFKYDNQIIFEKFIKGRELECAILGNENAEATAPGEIVIKGDYDFYSFDAKYVDGEAVDLFIPAKVQANIVSRIKELSVKSFHALLCEDYGRVDLFLTESGEVFINEINTIPGFTNSSMFPKLWENEGIHYSDLIGKLIELAMKRFKEQQRIQTDFESNLGE